MKTLSRRIAAFVLAGMMWTAALSAHPADVSQLRVRVERDHVDFRFTLNLASISRVVVVDTNQDNRITYAEIEAAAPVMRRFLETSTLVSINNEETDLGEFGKHKCFWPHPEDSSVTPDEQGQRFVDFNFTKRWPKGVEDVWLGFKVFEHFGDLHVIQCVYQQPGEHDTPVEFSAREPDYLYDTGWTATAQPEIKTSPVVTSTPSRSTSWSWVGGSAVVASLAALGLWGKRRSAIKS